MYDNSDSPEWWSAIFEPATFPHPVSKIETMETHISWVILTGEWVYKLKKPVDYGFVNFSTLDLRHRACLEELRLNRRTAPELYDDVVSLTAEPAGYRFGGQGRVLDYAVRMRQFPQSALLEACLERGELTESVIVTLAEEVAALHDRAEIADSTSQFGEPDVIQNAVNECLKELVSQGSRPEAKYQIDSINDWVKSEWQKRRTTFQARKQNGRVRECHGDLHLGNLVMFQGKPTLFDCIEFSEPLRWIDVINDVAFLVMDLCDHDRQQLGWKFLNAWLEHTGDFDGLVVLNYYLVYRALVRAKVDSIRLTQVNLPDPNRSHLQQQLDGYLRLAQSFTQSKPRGIILMHGVSGSGKTSTATKLAMQVPAVHIRSDVERKRLFGLWPPRTSLSETGRIDLYSELATQQTYQRLRELTKEILDAGFSVIVDATFLNYSDRAAFAQLAAQMNVSFVIRACEAPIEVLRQRVHDRQLHSTDASDADVEIIDRQRDLQEPFHSNELSSVARSDQDCLSRIGHPVPGAPD